MARNAEAGIDYFPMNTDIIHNPKVKLVVAEFGPKAWAVLLPLYCKIYREKGYWIDWYDEDSKLLFAQDDCKTDLATVREIVNGCIRRFLFDKEVFDMFGVLTSDRIQENYLEATKRRQSVDLISEFLVINNIKSDNVNIIALNVDIIQKKVNTGTQNKGEENKIKKIKGDKPDAPAHSSRFIKPTLEELKDFFSKKNLEKKLNWPAQKIDEKAEKFLAHYNSNGWKVGGKAPMRDWQAAVCSQWLKEKTWNNGTVRTNSQETKYGSNAETGGYASGF